MRDGGGNGGGIGVGKVFSLAGRQVKLNGSQQSVWKAGLRASSTLSHTQHVQLQSDRCVSHVRTQYGNKYSNRGPRPKVLERTKLRSVLRDISRYTYQVIKAGIHLLISHTNVLIGQQQHIN